MTATTAAGLPRVLVLSCGGTISSVPTAGGGAAPRLDAAALTGAIPRLAGVARVEAANFSALPSSHATLAGVPALRDEITRRVDDAGGDPFAGVVVTHGTDTLEEVAYALDLLWDRELPVVVTGAMRNAGRAGADGPANLLAAVVTAGYPAARGLGVLVVFNDEIHPAAYVRKAHTASVATFVSPTLGPIGYVSEDQPRIGYTPVGRRSLPEPPATVDGTAVALLTLGIGDDGRLLPAIAGAGYRGLVIEGYGGGHVSREIGESTMLDELVAVMPVVIASRTGAGPGLHHTYEFAGSEVDLLARGLIPAGDLDGLKARVLLTFLTAAGAGSDTVRRTFAERGHYRS